MSRAPRNCSQSKFTLGADASVAAGPVGRTSSAETDAQLHAEILTYSRSRGAFAGVSLQGATLRPDEDWNRELYSTPLTNQEIVMGNTPAPPAAAKLIQCSINIRAASSSGFEPAVRWHTIAVDRKPELTSASTGQAWARHSNFDDALLRELNRRIVQQRHGLVFGPHFERCEGEAVVGSPAANRDCRRRRRSKCRESSARRCASLQTGYRAGSVPRPSIRNRKSPRRRSPDGSDAWAADSNSEHRTSGSGATIPRAARRRARDTRSPRCCRYNSSNSMRFSEICSGPYHQHQSLPSAISSSS